MKYLTALLTIPYIMASDYAKYEKPAEYKYEVSYAAKYVPSSLIPSKY